MENKFPGNSYSEIKQKTEVAKKDEKKVVAKGRVINTKKSFGEKIAETFFMANFGSAIDHIFTDVLVPAIKDTFVDTIEGIINLMVYGDRYARRTYKRNSQGVHVSYDTISKRHSEFETEYKGKYWSPVKTISWDDPVKAMDVLKEMKHRILEYELITVQTYYEICGIESNYTDVPYGWYNLDRADIERIRNDDGDYVYILKLPRPVVIDS